MIVEGNIVDPLRTGALFLLNAKEIHKISQTALEKLQIKVSHGIEPQGLFGHHPLFVTPLLYKLCFTMTM